MKEDDPFSENPQMFKLVLKRGTWTTEEPTENDKKATMVLLPAKQDFGEREHYQEDENQKQLKTILSGDVK